MASVIQTKIFESIPERDGRKYVTYIFTSEFGDEIKLGPLLEDAAVDTMTRAQELEADALVQLANKERAEVLRDALYTNSNPADYTFKYNTKAAVISDMYSQNTYPLEQRVAENLSTIQNLNNRIRLFLGLV